jgi:hypothetical protein
MIGSPRGSSWGRLKQTGLCVSRGWHWFATNGFATSVLVQHEKEHQQTSIKVIAKRSQNVSSHAQNLLRFESPWCVSACGVHAPLTRAATSLAEGCRKLYNRGTIPDLAA